MNVVCQITNVYIINQGVTNPWSAASSLQRSPSCIEEINPRISPLPRRHSMVTREPPPIPKHKPVISNQLSLPAEAYAYASTPIIHEQDFEEIEPEEVFISSDENDEIEEHNFVAMTTNHRQSQPIVRFKGQILEPSRSEKKFVCIHPYEPSHPIGLWLEYGDVVQGSDITHVYRFTQIYYLATQKCMCFFFHSTLI